MEAVLNQSFSIGYEKTKKHIEKELNSRIDTVILNSIKGYLREKNVEFDGRSIDLKEFKENIVPTLDKRLQIDIANIEQGLNEQLRNLTEGLRDGSTTAFKKFTDGIGSFSKSTVEMIARLTAVETACAISPTAGGVAMGTSILAPKVIRTVKDIKKEMKDNTQAALDVMLLELGTITEDGKPQYEVSEESRKLIASNLKSEGIDLATNDTIHFLRDLSNLENAQKEKAVNMLNNLRGNPYDVKEEIGKTKINLAKIKKIMGNDIVSPLSTAALFGMAAGSTLTETMPDLAPSVITALSAGAITGDLGIGTVSGGSQYLLSKFGNYIPIVGNAIEDFTKTVGAKETILASTGTAAIATLGLKIIPKLIYKGAKGTFHKIKTRRDAKAQKRDLNEQVATTDVENRIKKAREVATNEIEEKSDGDILLDVIIDTLRSEGIAIPQEVRTQEELKAYVNKLSDKEKRDVYRIATVLEDIKENNTKSLKTTLSKVAKTAYWGGVLALAGLGAYDAFINPGFLDGLASKKELEKQLSEPSQENIPVTQDMINSQAKVKLQNDLDLAKQQVDDSMNQIREILPESKEEYSTLMSEQPGLWQKFTTFWKNNQRDYENNKAIELLGIDNEEGLNAFLYSIDPNDENLKNLMNQLGVNSIDELASNYELQASLNLVGGGNWYFPDLTTYTGKSGSREVGNTLIKIINSKYAENISEIPLQTASDKEIIAYIQSLSEDKTKINALSTYIGIHNEDANMFDYIAECSDDFHNGSSKVSDLIGKISGYSNNDMNMNEVIEGTKKVSKLANKYQDSVDVINEIQKESEGYMAGINTNMTNNPWIIGGTGAVVGAGLEAVNESKNIFARAKRFIKSKLFAKNKNKALPSGNTITNERVTEETLGGTSNRFRLNVAVNKDKLNKKIISQQKATTKEEKEQEFE